MVKCPGMSRDEARQLGITISNHVTSVFPKPCKMKLEDVFQPFLIQITKHYAGVVDVPIKNTATTTNSNDNSSNNSCRMRKVIKVKGFECERRDAVPVLRSLMRDMLHDVLCKNSAPMAVERMKECVRQVLQGTRDHELVLTAAL